MPARLDVSRAIVVCRTFMCPKMGHKFQALVRRREHSATGELVSQFQPINRAGGGWFAMPVCHEHHVSGIEEQFYDPAMQVVPEKERFVAWLSPDGERLAVPGAADARMPDRYRLAGYQRVEGFSMMDLDRFDKIRARQTGNIVHNEMNYGSIERRHRELDEPDFDSDDILKSEI
jgi:hypothetical protein